MRNFELPGRSPVYASNGMVACSHPLASSSALKILQNGGNAVDAAIAANAVLAVVEPHMTGIGGDCFCIVAEPNGTLHALNGSGRSAAKAHLSWYLENNIQKLVDHPEHAVTVPGSVKAWETVLQKFGTQGFDQLFNDAIAYAENGFAIAPRIASDWLAATDKLSKNIGASIHYLNDNKAPRCGEVVSLPALAKTLRAIALKGSSAFYEGAIAKEIANTIQSLGGFLSEEDLANVSVDWVTPISTLYKGHELFELPPNGQGITALVMLNLLDKFNASLLPANSVERVHLEMECARLAYSVRDDYVADADAMKTSVQAMLSDAHTSSLAALYNAEKRNDNIILPELPNADTVYLTVVDKDQRAVSFINSIYMSFGSGIVTEESGIALQNRGACFVVEDGHVNAIDARKRPMHTIIPSLVKANGKVQYSFGVMGGAYQPVGHTHVLCNMLDYGMDPQEALDHCRVFWGDDDVLELESSAPKHMREGLESLGHKVRKASSPHGGGQIIRIDHESGVFIGGSDPRKDGQAQGY